MLYAVLGETFTRPPLPPPPLENATDFCSAYSKNTSSVLHAQKSTQKDFFTAYSKKHSNRLLYCIVKKARNLYCALKKALKKCRQKRQQKNTAKKLAKNMPKKYIAIYTTPMANHQKKHFLKHILEPVLLLS
jgi:hypothetical protein